MRRRNWNINLAEMVKAGVHLGHRTHNWNPRMAPYIAAKRKGKYLINLIRTARFLSEACDLLFDASSRGQTFLIVGTQKKEADLVVRAARMAQCYYVNQKWIRGMLTNWSIIKKRLQKFRKLRDKQKRGFHRLTKKHAAMVKKQLVHFRRYFDGIEDMESPPHIVIVLNQHKDSQALQECLTLGIPTISLIDTNGDPDLADLPIPANDDSTSSIQFILYKLVFAICKGRSL